MRASCCLLWACVVSVAAAQDFPRDRRALFQSISNSAQNIKVTADDVAVRAAQSTPDSATILDQVGSQIRGASLIDTLFWRIADLRMNPVLDREEVYRLHERADKVANTAMLELVALQRHPASPNWKRLRSLAKTQAKRSGKLAEIAARLQ